MASKRKRDREEDTEVDEALHQLQGTLERDYQHKLRALDKVISLVDPSDDHYTVQRALVNGEAAFYITELLSDPTAGTRAAEAVAAVCCHAAPSMARLAAGPLMGLDSSVERVSLNPCQADFVDSGALAALVPMALGRQEAAREAAGEAITALCSFHQDGKLAYLEALVQALSQRKVPQALAHIDALIDGMDCGGNEAAALLDALLPPLLEELQGGAGPASGAAAVSLVGTLCEQRPEAAQELRRGGAVAAVAQHLLAGSQEVQDVAARALWLLAKDDRDCLADGQQGLQCSPSKVASVLVQLIETADAEEARARQDFGAGGEDDGCTREAGDGAATPTAADICHSREATELLTLLAGLHPEVARLVEERQVPLASEGSKGCCVM